jgi:hypothetical protein
LNTGEDVGQTSHLINSEFQIGLSGGHNPMEPSNFLTQILRFVS